MTEDLGPPPARPSATVRLAYALGEIPNAVKTAIAGLFGLYFYTSVMGLSGSWVGIAAVIGLTWDAVIDPYVGYLSDRSRYRLGRRHLFMLLGALTMGLGFWASFSPPAGLSQGWLLAWLLATSFFVRAATSVYRVPYYALGAELSTDYRERTTITSARSFFSVIGTVAAATLAFVVFFPNQAPGVDPKLAYDSYPMMGLVFGVAMTAIALVTTLGTLGSGSPVDAGLSERPTRLGFIRDFVSTLHNPSFGLLLASSFFFFLAVAMNGSLSLHFLTYYAEIGDSWALSGFQLAFYLGGLMGLVVWRRIGFRIDKHKLYLAGTLATAAIMAATFALIGRGHPLGVGNVPALLVIHAGAGFTASVVWFLPTSMIADVVDTDELVSGSRREGAFFGAFSFAQQIAFGFSLLFAGVLLDLFAGLVPGAEVQSAQTAWRIGFLYAIPPAVSLLLAAASIFPYRPFAASSQRRRATAHSVRSKNEPTLEGILDRTSYFEIQLNKERGSRCSVARYSPHASSRSVSVLLLEGQPKPGILLASGISLRPLSCHPARGRARPSSPRVNGRCSHRPGRLLTRRAELSRSVNLRRSPATSPSR